MMLVVDPAKRYTVDQCLAHPWMSPDSVGLTSGVARTSASNLSKPVELASMEPELLSKYFSALKGVGRIARSPGTTPRPPSETSNLSDIARWKSERRTDEGSAGSEISRGVVRQRTLLSRLTDIDLFEAFRDFDGNHTGHVS